MGEADDGSGVRLIATDTYRKEGVKPFRSDSSVSETRRRAFPPHFLLLNSLMIPINTQDYF
jgi:hypothetical protein